MKFTLLFIVTTFLISACYDKSNPGNQGEQVVEQIEKKDAALPPETKKSLVDQRVEYEIELAQKKDPNWRFGNENGWKELYETGNPITLPAESDMSNYDKQIISDEFIFSNENSRLRIKATGYDFPLMIKLLKKNSYGGFEEVKKHSVSQESFAAYDFGILSGTYHIEVSYNSVQTTFRLVWEKEGK